MEQGGVEWSEAERRFYFIVWKFKDEIRQIVHSTQIRGGEI